VFDTTIHKDCQTFHLKKNMIFSLRKSFWVENILKFLFLKTANLAYLEIYQINEVWSVYIIIMVCLYYEKNLHSRWHDEYFPFNRIITFVPKSINHVFDISVPRTPHIHFNCQTIYRWESRSDWEQTQTFKKKSSSLIISSSTVIQI
jgi:hypothetical protein